MKLTFYLLIGLLSGCAIQKTVFDNTREFAAIQQVQEDHRNAHFTKDAAAFVATFAENFVSVNRGKITTPTKEESTTLFQGYFDAVEFQKWDDVTNP